jgi:3',5'-cyclic AMP phosphodiesterase CpdA
MKKAMDRRSFLKVAGVSLGMGALYQFGPLLGRAGADPISDFFRRANGEAPTSFRFVQLSDTHVGFQGPPSPLGTAAFEASVSLINRLPERPDLVLFTGDLTHDVENPNAHAQRMKQFRSIASRINTPMMKFVPGENDAALDGGTLFRNFFGETHYSFDHRGVHFVALDNVSRGSPEVGPEQLNWLKKDLARFPKTAPIVVFTHRPLFDLKPEWEWFTRDGDQVMNVLAPYQNVTVLYGHIHRKHFHDEGRVKHYAARSLIFAFPDPATVEDKNPLPFDKTRPFKNLGIRLVGSQGRQAPSAPLAVEDVELTMREFSGTSGIQQFMKSRNPAGEENFNDAD